MASQPPPYLIDFKQLIYNLLPHFLRKSNTLKYLYAAAGPLRLLNSTFSSFTTNINYSLDFSGQTIYLEHYLNDQHDPIGRGIFINSININVYNYIFNLGENYQALYVFNTSEGGPLYLQNYSELLAGDAFIIFVPVALAYNSIDFNENVAYYAIAGARWSIQTY